MIYLQDETNEAAWNDPVIGLREKPASGTTVIGLIYAGMPGGRIDGVSQERCEQVAVWIVGSCVGQHEQGATVGEGEFVVSEHNEIIAWVI